MTVAELQARMSQAEFEAWRLFAAHEPIGPARGDVQAALIASTLANTHRNRKKRRKPFLLSDFMPDFWKLRSRGNTLQAKLRGAFAAIKRNGPQTPQNGPDGVEPPHRG
jgi:hypothetical protein